VSQQIISPFWFPQETFFFLENEKKKGQSISKRRIHLTKRLIQDYYRKEEGFECKKTIAVVETNKRKP
jgi:hypothetical protein